MRRTKSFSTVGPLHWGALAGLLLIPAAATAQDGDWSSYNYDARGSRFNQ